MSAPDGQAPHAWRVIPALSRPNDQVRETAVLAQVLVAARCRRVARSSSWVHCVGTPDGPTTATVSGGIWRRMLNAHTSAMSWAEAAAVPSAPDDVRRPARLLSLSGDKAAAVFPAGRGGPGGLQRGARAGSGRATGRVHPGADRGARAGCLVVRRLTC